MCSRGAQGLRSCDMEYVMLHHIQLTSCLGRDNPQRHAASAV